MARFGLAVCVLIACGKTRHVPAPAPAPAPPQPRSAQPVPRARPPAPEIEPISETEARVVLSGRFRARGFRVRYDVRLREPDRFDLTLDGYDPAARVGFEYIAAAEHSTDIDARERAALAGDSRYRILIVDATSRPELERAAEQFLGALEARAW